MAQLRRSITPELSALLRSGSMLQVADLYTITLSGGLVLRWTNHDQAVTIGGDTWVSGPGLSRDNMSFKAGVEAQSMEIVITADASQTLNGSPVVPFVLNGGFDGAEVSLAKAFRAELGDAAWVGKLEQFAGRVSDVQSGGRLQVSVTVRSVLELFNLPLPPSVYQPQCLNTVFDENCGLFRAGYQNGGAVSVGSGALRLTFGHTLPFPGGHFDLGAVEFISGANAGVRRTVRVHTVSQVTVLQPWPNLVEVGDAFNIYRGCDLTMATCRDRYNNLSRFRGHPFVPPPEIVT